MESSTNKYLHKKFKKQISEIRSQDINSENNVVTSQNSEKNVAIAVQEKFNSELINCANNIDSVPKQSTNHCNSPLFCNVNSPEKSSISPNVIKVNVIRKNDDCIQQQLQPQQPLNYNKSRDVQSSADATNPQSTNSCISYIFSSVEGQTPIENSNNDTNFDTNFKVIEPKQLKKSSISKITQDSNIILPFIVHSADKILEDISSISSNFKETSIHDSKTCNKSNEKHDNQTIEKSVGGKYICPYCNLVCSKPSVLQKHIRAHTNERPYPCESCGSRFKTRSNLYKHCRSRTHANRVMGNKSMENNNDGDGDSQSKYEYYNNKNEHTESNRALMKNNDAQENLSHDQTAYVQQRDSKPKPYKPRFHTVKLFYDNLTKENVSEEQKNSKNANISSHINELITKNHYIVNTNENYFSKRTENASDNLKNCVIETLYNTTDHKGNDEPLNLSNKNRKRCLSEVAEPTTQKSLIKELLLKNLYAGSDMQCPHCKMLFQTVTELDIHKLRSCKGFTKSGARYSRSSSVNVASILTQNKNAFDGIPQLQETFFPLKSPGPFLGKTRLIDSDKSKSFSFEDGIQCTRNDMLPVNDFLRSNYRNLSMLGDGKRPPVKLFGGEVKITHTSGETKSFKVDNKESDSFLTNNADYGSKVSENTVVKSILQSGGTVLQNKTTYKKQDLLSPVDVMKAYQSKPVSPENSDHNRYSPVESVETFGSQKPVVVSTEYTNIMDFSQKAAKSFAPNLKQLNLTIPGVPMPSSIPNSSPITYSNHDESPLLSPKDPHLHAPMTFLVNGKMVRYVPGIPGPITADVHYDPPYKPAQFPNEFQKPTFKITFAERPLDEKPAEAEHTKNNSCVETVPDVQVPESRSPKSSKSETPKKFVRPNSLALKPTLASLKQHHGLTPTVFNQILISPDTPRVAKKYIEYQRNGYYFSSLGLKSSTKSVYCTLNKTQPFYVPHFKKLSMYSEWRQQDTKADKLYVSAYDSRQKQQKYAVAPQVCKPLVVHSSYKFTASKESYKEETGKANQIAGGYESNEKYTYVRGRGRGRYVCDQCGIRCKKPSMLRKHVRTHTNDRPYTCSHCNFSFKTKGNLTKHMKCKSHTKNSYASSSGCFSQPNSSPTSDSDTDDDDSGMDSSDESTRQHEAAYGLLSLSQKASSMDFPAEGGLFSSISSAMDTEEIVHVSKTSFVKNKILDSSLGLSKTLNKAMPSTDSPLEARNLNLYMGKTIVDANRPLTYPYTSPLSPGLLDKLSDKQSHESAETERMNTDDSSEENGYVMYEYGADDPKELSNRRRRNNSTNSDLSPVSETRKRKCALSGDVVYDLKMQKQDAVMDLSLSSSANKENGETYDGSEHNNVHYHASHNSNYNHSKRLGDCYANEYEPVRFVQNGEANYLSEDSCSDPGKVYKHNISDYDNSAMETLADIATKQMKLEKNSMAKNVATEFLKLATKNDAKSLDNLSESGNFIPNNKDVNDLIAKREENKSCTICLKNFSKPSQLRLHMNIHYLERPFRCDPCAVSFRTKGHLQKHERSAMHHNKLSSPALSSSEPRPFKCSDCNSAFRIHGHLAKHLRSKMHIMKLECLAKIPFGLYAELERSNSLLTEINTSDGEQCLESLKNLAKKVFINDPNKLNQSKGSSNVINVINNSNG